MTQLPEMVPNQRSPVLAVQDMPISTSSPAHMIPPQHLENTASLYHHQHMQPTSLQSQHFPQPHQPAATGSAPTVPVSTSQTHAAPQPRARKPALLQDPNTGTEVDIKELANQPSLLKSIPQTPVTSTVPTVPAVSAQTQDVSNYYLNIFIYFSSNFIFLVTYKRKV